MRHARADYNRIQDPQHKIPEDEPVFLLRGQDRHAADAVDYYARQVAAAGGDPRVIEESLRQAHRMAHWPVKKAPDLLPSWRDSLKAEVGIQGMQARPADDMGTDKGMIRKQLRPNLSPGTMVSQNALVVDLDGNVWWFDIGGGSVAKVEIK